ncbi:MAG: outer membrane lipoprotein LolB [Bermanella sp.]|nr:outer membrane lipoprotein LolB [Bermanella sp.]|tara:strand:- start:946 stop:1482 length:537 start_codon:yes stop_codon:yes gene_type:complete
MLKLIFTLALCQLLLACSTVPDSPAQSNWAVSGKIGITTPTQSVAGFILWKQQGKDFDIYVSGPFSVGSTRIQGNIASISLTQGGKTVEGINPQQLIYEELGWFFPIENLPFWLKGQVAPYSPAQRDMNKNKQLSQIKQDKWKVEFLRYNDYYALPERIRISQGQWKFLVVIKHWEFD